MDGAEPTDDDSPAESIAVGVAMLVGFGVAGLLLALHVEWWWIGFPLMGALIPIAVGIARWATESESGARNAESSEDAALAELRRRYAEGEVTEAEFERRLERLLETETVADAREQVWEWGGGTGRSREAGRAGERESEEV